MTGVLLHHREAVHASQAHFVHPNQSILRFKTAAQGEYSADLVFEIDAHGKEPDYPRSIDYMPFVRVALMAGQRLLRHLVHGLAVPPAWITASVTRMGVTVTVDWRALGPRRTWELLLLLRSIESQVFGRGELAELGKTVGAELKIDPNIYVTSDLARRPGALGGHWLRPLGALHAKSSDATAWFRKTPIPHEHFIPDAAELLTLASRGNSPDSATWARPEWLEPTALIAWPEMRWPGSDSRFEGRLPPAKTLTDLIDRDGTLDELQEGHRLEVHRVRERSIGAPKIKRTTESHPEEVSEELLGRVVTALTPNARERGDCYQIDCPRSACKERDRKAAIFKTTGRFTCFRCLPGTSLSLRELLTELGLLHLLPRARGSSNPIQRRLIEDLPVTEEHWSQTMVVDREFEELDAARADQMRVVEDFLDDDKMRLLALVAAPGIGKTTAVASISRERGLQLRAFLSRDDAKDEFKKLIPEARVVIGRRYGTNCWNADLVEVSSRHEPIAEALCSTCEDRERCGKESDGGYWSQFRVLPHPTPLILHHNHGIHADLAVLDNNSVLDFVDEDALGATVELVDFTGEELALLRVRMAIDDSDVDDDGCFGLGDRGGPTIERVAPTAVWESVVAGLERRLTTDAILSFDAHHVGLGSIADLALADLLFRDAELRSAVGNLDAAHFEALQADVLVLREVHQNLRAVSRRAEAELTRLSHDAKEARAVHESVKNLAAETDELRRPIDRARDLVEALRSLLYSHETRRNITSALQAIRTAKGTSWVLRLTVKRTLLPSSHKVIHASASMNAERLRLMHVPPTPDARWTLYRPRLPQRERWTVVADRNYGKGTLINGKDAEKARNSVFEAVRKLIEIEGKRTCLPVAVIGPSAIVNRFNEEVLGKLDSDLEMPFSTRRSERLVKLREITEPRGYICGYAYGVAGTNSFSAEADGKTVFLRALIILGNCVPNLREYAQAHRGLFAGCDVTEPVEGPLCDAAIVTDLAVDWSMSFRTVPVPGTECDGEITVLTNVPGYADPIANAVLAGTFEGELLQIAGRIRGHIPDPRDPTIEPRIYQFAAAVVPGVRVDRVLALDELRVELGLTVDEKRRNGRPPTLSFEDRLRRRVRKEGKPAAIRWVMQRAIAENNESPLTGVRLAFANADVPYSDADAAAARRALAEIRRRNLPPNSQ